MCEQGCSAFHSMTSSFPNFNFFLSRILNGTHNFCFHVHFANILHNFNLTFLIIIFLVFICSVSDFNGFWVFLYLQRLLWIDVSKTACTETVFSIVNIISSAYAISFSVKPSLMYSEMQVKLRSPLRGE